MSNSNKPAPQRTYRDRQDHIWGKVSPGTARVGQTSLTTMPVEHLHDLAGLQVPDKDLAILTSTDDILTLRRRRYKCIWDAIRSINVTSVRLHTARGLVVPQPDCGILCRA